MRRKIFAVFFAVLLIFIVFSGCVKEEAPDISPKNNEPVVIQQLIDNASEGDVIIVPSGTYNETIFINKSITLIGENKVDTVIDGMFPKIYSKGNAITINSDNVRISNFTIRNITTGSLYPNNNCGIQINSNFNEISNNVFSKSRFGIFLNYSNNNKILSNDFTNIDYDGVYLDFSDNNNISNNNFSTSSSAGVNLNNSCSNNTISNNIISGDRYGVIVDNKGYDNKFYNNDIFSDWESFFIHGSNKSTIKGNFLNNNGICLSGLSYNNDISNNLVKNKELVYLEDKSNLIIDYDVGQILIVNCDNITVSNQNLNNVSYGLELIDSQDCIISNNYFNDISITGLFIADSENNVVTDNFFLNCSQGILISADRNIIKNNEFIDNSQRSQRSIGMYYSFHNTISYNYLGDLVVYSSDFNTIRDNTFNGSIQIFDSNNTKNNVIINNNFNN
jgi:parallel beta-helix repeat protein